MKPSRWLMAVVSAAGVAAACSAKAPVPLSASAAAVSEPVSTTSQGAPQASAPDCLQFLEQARAGQENGAFFGFGEGATSGDAVNISSADLVRQIQTRVSSSGVTRESNREVEFSTLTQSTVDAMLTGMDVARRCRDGFRWQAVTRLEKAVFFRNIQLRARPLIRDATVLGEVLASRSVPASELIGAATRARAMIRGDFVQARDMIAVCRTLGSCATIDDSAFSRLEAAAAAVFGRFAFVLRPVDDEAAAVAGVVSRLLAEEGFAITNGEGAANQARLSCQRKDYPPMARTGYMVTEVICGATFIVGSGDPVAGLTRTYFGNGLGESRQEAISEARRKLTRKGQET